MTKTALEAAFHYNETLDKVFNTDDPDTAANIFINEFNIIIDNIAP